MSPQAPQVGELVRYYYEGSRKGSGWKHGHVIEIKPRKKEARIKPIGPGRAIWASFENVEGVE